MSSSKGNHLLLPERHDIRTQHTFLWKTWGWFTCRWLRKSYTTHYTLKPQIIVPRHPSRDLDTISFVPIKGNRILLFARYSTRGWGAPHYLHLSIHEICSDHRVGPAVWYFKGRGDGHFDIPGLEVMKSTENALGITFGARFHDHWKLFDISTTKTDASNKLPLIESGRLHFDLKFKSNVFGYSRPGLSKIFMQSCWTCSDVFQVTLSPDMPILLNVDLNHNQHNETVEVHYLNPGGTNFSFVTRMSIPHLRGKPDPFHSPELAFSPDGSKFAMGTGCSGVSVWNIQSKVPLWTFMEAPWPNFEKPTQPYRFLQFSSGNLGKEILVFAEVCLMFTFWYPYLSNRWSESLAQSNHSCDRCDIVWDGTKTFLKVWKPGRSARTLPRSRRGNSVR